MGIAILVIDTVIEQLKDHAKEATIAAGAAAVGVVAGGVAIKTHDQKVIATEKKKSFEHGLRKGAVIGRDAQIQVSADMICAWSAMAYYVAKADGRVSWKEKKLLQEKLDSVLAGDFADKELKSDVKAITSLKEISFGDVTAYLDNLPTGIISSFIEDMYCIVKSSNGISPEEKVAIEEIEEYIAERTQREAILSKKKTYNTEAVIDSSEAYFDYLVEQKISKEVQNYSLKMKLLDMTFTRKTKLAGKEIALLFAAVCLQVSRIYLTNNLTQIEKAGAGNKKEAFLHKQQERILAALNNGEIDKPHRYYAPLNQIIRTMGVPYDTTLQKKGLDLEIFKGANHRFATLGHDPLIGLVVGTVNIATNTITTVPNTGHLPSTYHVRYDSNLKNPTITEVAFLPEAVSSVIDRTKEDMTPLVAAFIKQLIHIATDMYTPAGIYLPGANLVLSNNSVEKITKFVSTGDVLKIGVTATFAEIINKLIEILYGCFLMEESPDLLEEESCKVKLKKIILYSNLIASGSSYIQAFITNNPKNVDWGGIAILMGRLFNDMNFIYDIKNEFISRGLGEADF